METLDEGNENEPTPKDISQEFLSMSTDDFLDYLDTLGDEPSLSITIDWRDELTALRLKAFLEDYSAPGQKRSATIRATQAKYEQVGNVFASGVKWIEVQ
jgi:hypothetical protein